MQQGKTDTPAKSIVCLPHRLVVTVFTDSDQDENDLDVIVQ